MTNDNESGVSKATPDEMMSDANRQAQAINRQNEAEDVNKMVDKGLLSPEEAKDFSHEKEIEIPEALLSKAPKISERLREHVVSKFPADSFLPENIAGTVIHGTSIRAIKPIWLGEGKQKTYEGRSFSEEAGSVFSDVIAENKGKFKVTGDFTRLDNNGFNKIGLHGKRNPGFEAIGCMPIYFAMVKAFREERKEQLDYADLRAFEGIDIDKYLSGESGPDDTLHTRISAVVLTKPEDLLLEDPTLKSLPRYNGKEAFKVDGESLYMTVQQEANYIAHCMVQGIDKSKIVPIYDWDGNLLWPKDNDTSNPESENEEE